MGRVQQVQIEKPVGSTTRIIISLKAWAHFLLILGISLRILAGSDPETKTGPADNLREVTAKIILQ